MIEKLCGEANVDAKDVIIAYLTKQVQELEGQFHDASIQIQELIEKDIWCPSNCEKLEKLHQENKQLKDNWNKLKEIIKKKQDYYSHFKDNRYRKFLSELLDIMQELEGSDK